MSRWPAGTPAFAHGALEKVPPSCGSYKELLWQNYALYRKRDGAHETGHGLKKRAFLRM